MGFARRIMAFLSFAFWSTIEGMRCKRPDVVFATSTPITVAIPGLIVSIFKRRPLVFEVRDIWPESAIATGVLKNPLIIKAAEFLERLIYRRSRRIIALSERMKKRMVENGGPPPDKVDVIPIGADLDLFGGERDDSFRRQHGLEGKFLAVFPGAHGIANGLDVLVEAARLLPDDMRIVLIGDGPRKPRLMEKARRLGADKILFFDPIPKLELARVLTCMDCGLMILKPLPIFETVLPNKLFDLAASRLPIIVNFAGEVADLVTTHEAGLFVERSTPQNIADALVTLRDNSEQRREMGENARRLARRFDRRKMAERFQAVLEEVVARDQKK